jgi:hypothetical protein
MGLIVIYYKVFKLITREASSLFLTLQNTKYLIESSEIFKLSKTYFDFLLSINNFSCIEKISLAI